MLSPHEFYLKYNGTSTDIDGAAGVQCVDLWKLFLKELGVPNPTKPLGGTGYAKEIWNRRVAQGYMNYFVEASVNDLRDGDWCVWGNCDACPSSHVAMFRLDNGNGTGIFLGQNQGSKKVNQINLPYAGIIGVLRPKVYVTTSACPFKKSGTVEAIETNIRVRTAPSLSKGDTGLRYQPGERLIYYDVVEADGWYWAKYTRSLNGASGTGYCALCKTDSTSKFWKQV